MTNRFPGVANRLAARGTGARGGDHPSAQAKEQPGIHRRGVRHHLHVGGAGDVVGVLFGEHRGKLADRPGAAGRRAVGDAGLTVGQHRVVDQSRLLQRQLGGAGREQRHPAHGANALTGIVSGESEIFNRRGEQGLQAVIRLPLRHGTHRIFILAQTARDGRPVLAERGDAAHARNHYPAGHSMPPLIEIT